MSDLKRVEFLPSPPDDFFRVEKGKDGSPYMPLPQEDIYARYVVSSETHLGRLFRESLAKRHPDGLTGPDNALYRAHALDMYRRLNHLGQEFHTRNIDSISEKDFNSYPYNRNDARAKMEPGDHAKKAIGDLIEISAGSLLSSGLAKQNGIYVPYTKTAYASFTEDLKGGIDYRAQSLPVDIEVDGDKKGLIQELQGKLPKVGENKRVRLALPIDISTAGSPDSIKRKLDKVANRNLRRGERGLDRITALFVPLRRDKTAEVDGDGATYEYMNALLNNKMQIADKELPWALHEIGRYNLADPEVLKQRPLHVLSPAERLFFESLLAAPDNIAKTTHQ